MLDASRSSLRNILEFAACKSLSRYIAFVDDDSSCPIFFMARLLAVVTSFFLFMNVVDGFLINALQNMLLFVNDFDEDLSPLPLLIVAVFSSTRPNGARLLDNVVVLEVCCCCII